ncbi:MAG: tetratricopeptide repeat protein [Myxococcales bacterium]|nr:MAG: tetratricopeptide repeat protein [Myxococcales bacterium]
MRKLTLVLGLSTMALTTAAYGADPQAPVPASKSSAPSAPAVGADGVRRDAKGVKGISPYVELVNKGDRAYVSRDFDGAIAAYREAIQTEPQNPVGHYRVGSAQLAKGDQKEAEAAWVAGLRFAGQDGTIKARIQFALADLRERQKNSDEAIARWKDYSKTAEDYKEATTYPATATERVSRNEAWKKNAAESAEVKERIAKRLKEADEASRKSAADPKNK